MKGAVHQLTSGFASGDAISQEALLLRDIIRDLGFQSEIFAPADRTAPDMKSVVRPLDEYKAGADDAAIYHYSIQSPASAAFESGPARKAMIYHNITPAEYFRPYDDGVAIRLQAAREALIPMAGKCRAVWADSAFNASELIAAGVAKAKVFHLAFSPKAWTLPPDPVVAQGLSTPLTKILFVGRLAPNKCVEELIEAFAWYHYGINRNSELIVVGSDRSCPAYFAMLRMFAGELDLDHVNFVRYSSPAGLMAYYGKADVFVSASRHEGYCLPLVEAMCKDVPVLARNVGGVPEAMDGAGVLFEDCSSAELAGLIHRVTTDRVLRDEILASQRARVQRAENRPLKDEVAALVRELVS